MINGASLKRTVREERNTEAQLVQFLPVCSNCAPLGCRFLHPQVRFYCGYRHTERCPIKPGDIMTETMTTQSPPPEDAPMEMLAISNTDECFKPTFNLLIRGNMLTRWRQRCAKNPFSPEASARARACVRERWGRSRFFTVHTIKIVKWLKLRLRWVVNKALSFRNTYRRNVY